MIGIEGMGLLLLYGFWNGVTFGIEGLANAMVNSGQRIGSYWSICLLLMSVASMMKRRVILRH